MRYSRQHHLSAYASLLSALLVVTIASQNNHLGDQVLIASMGTTLGLSENLHAAAELPDTQEFRIASRLQKRLKDRGQKAPPIHKIAQSVEQRQKLLTNETTIRFVNEDGTLFHEWEVSAQHYPLWIKTDFNWGEANFSIDSDAITAAISSEIKPLINWPVHADLREIIPKNEVTKVDADLARAGQVLDINDAAMNIQLALASDLDTVEVVLKDVAGRVTNETTEDLGSLQLLASGRSNFKGSTWSRSFNVRKALREHVNNTLVAPGESFSFNNTLDGYVSLGNGWTMAKIIVNGSSLEDAPGGGICQASTTVYRAILNAGFPVTERKSHSLYVTYYKEYGVGIDATIFPGAQDLVFTNDTNSHLLIQAYDDGYEAVVNIYGTPDGRTSDLQGPFFTENAPEGLKISRNEIVWLQQVNYPDGRKEENTITSRYRSIPNYVRNEYTMVE